MELIIFSPKKNEAGKRLQKVLLGLSLKIRTIACPTFTSLVQELDRPTYDQRTAVLLAATRKDFNYILTIPDLLTDIHVILIIPNRGKQTIAQAHGLRPRFLSYTDSNFQDVAAVLEKMIDYRRTQKRF
ncbi:MAG: hypothetical protein SV487_03685 [Thermodesulfobacteriota bacterium]|nr:hypothetical protein [Thermodesulfobacteriota bacterium]